MKRLVVEETMPLERSAAWTTPAERAAAAAFGSARRRQEYLAWRAVVRRELGRDVRIGYDAFGAPTIDLPGVYLGVAHCDRRIALCLSSERCAVDIEPEGRDFLRAASRYLAPEERALTADALLPGAVWCAKEALFKYAGRPGLDLLRDIRILDADLLSGRLTGRIGTDDDPIAVSLRRCDGFLVAYIL